MKEQREADIMLDWIEEHRPQICKIRASECQGDFIELDTNNGTWRGKTLRNALRSAMKVTTKK